MTTQKQPRTPYDAEIAALESSAPDILHAALTKAETRVRLYGQREQQRGYLRAVADYAPLVEAARSVRNNQAALHSCRVVDGSCPKCDILNRLRAALAALDGR